MHDDTTLACGIFRPASAWSAPGPHLFAVTQAPRRPLAAGDPPRLMGGISVLSSCREGTCGTCEVPVLEGVSDHRDSVLDQVAREVNDCMMICISRSCTPWLVLDL